MHTDGGVNERLKRAFPAMKASFAGVRSLHVEGMDAVVGELTIIGSDSDGSTISETRAAAFGEAEGLRFPAFSLQPQSVLLKLMPGILGLEAVKVAGDAGFARAYHLSAVHPQKTRALFNEGVVAWLAAHPGLRLESSGRGMLLYCAGRSRPEPESFARDAAEIFHRLAESQRNAPPVAPQDARSAAEATQGPLGKRVRKELVTRADLAAFLAQPLPRKPGSNIREYCERRSPPMWPGIGLIFATVGAAFAYGFGVQGDWKGILFGAAFVAVGAPVAFFTGRTHLRLMRLLRRGEVVSARIERLEDTGWWTSTTGALWRLRLRYSLQGQPRESEATISGFAIERAQQALDAGKPVTILVDPRRAERVLLADDLLTVSPEYEP
ncbi:MAG: hypothetical protein QOD26_4185 [Betaproteobacteria bacterium]|jgi:hypothetical protein|nr:hypothetical protein [Betaproteobacteria bacterium]